METVTYTPAEFAAVFGKERTWAYRQLYAGKVQAVTSLGRTLIPKSEVDRLLMEAGRYLGSKAKVRKAKLGSINNRKSSGAKSWADAIKQRKTTSTTRPQSALINGRKPPDRGNRLSGPSDALKSAYQRLTRKP